MVGSSKARNTFRRSLVKQSLPIAMDDKLIHRMPVTENAVVQCERDGKSIPSYPDIIMFTPSGPASACPSGLPGAHSSQAVLGADNEFCPQVSEPIVAGVSSRRRPCFPRCVRQRKLSESQSPSPC